jgi:hypothetical protein
MSSTKNSAFEVNAVVGQPQACRLTRTELMQALIDSGYGEREAVYRALLRRAEDGSALCNSCGMRIGQHADRSDPLVVTADSVVVAADPALRRDDNEVTFPAPDCTIQQYCRDPALHDYTILSSVSPVPLHWVGATWYAPFVDYVDYSQRVSTHALLKYRCNMDGCGKLFEVAGPRVDSKNKAPIGPVSLKTRSSGETIEAHMEYVHGLKHLPAGRFATRLFDCCKDPAFTTTCCIVYTSTMPLGGDRGVPTCCAINRVFNRHAVPLSICAEMVEDPHGISFVDSASLDKVQCQWHLAFVVMYDLLMMPLMGSGFLVASIVTLFGFPCNSDSLPPLLCFTCYKHRRLLVQVLGADETPFQSRVKATFCCYCSEVQVWRELKASGVWAGLLCCTASEEDREYMSASAVRQRYSVDGAYAVRATSVEGEQLLQGVREQIFDGPDPNLCYAMK